MRPIAIGPIKYVTHDTMPAGSGILRCNVSYILRRQLDHGETSPTIWTGETGMVRNCDLSVADISIFFNVLRRGLAAPFESEKSIIMEYAGRDRPRPALGLSVRRFHLSGVAFCEVSAFFLPFFPVLSFLLSSFSSSSSLLPFFLFFFLFFLYTELAKLYYQLLLSKFPTHLARPAMR